MGRLDGKATDFLAPSADRDKLGLFTYDIKQDLVFADAAVAELFGIDADETKTGLPISRFADAVHPDDRSEFDRDIAARKPDACFEHHYRTVQSDGSVRRVKAIGQCFPDRDGRPAKQAGLATLEGNKSTQSSNDRLLDLCIRAHDEAEATNQPMIAYMLSMMLLDLGYDVTDS